MKKIHLFSILLIAIILVTGCGSSKKNRSVEDLLDTYVKAITKADAEAAKSIFPQFYVKSVENRMTNEFFEKSLESLKKEYGDDFTITYEITDKKKLSDEELDKVNESMARHFDTEDKALECYQVEGAITFKGSNKEDEDPIDDMGYCRYDDGWYLIGG